MPRAESRNPVPTALRAAALVSVVLLVAVVTACQEGASKSPTASDTASATSESPPSESPTVEPATGPWIRWPQVQVRAPAGWEFARRWSTKLAQRPDGYDMVSLNSGPTMGDPEPTREVLRRLSESETGLVQYKGKPKVDLEVSLAGRPAVKMWGPASLGDDVTYITVYDNHVVTLGFLFKEWTPRDERKEIMESVLATFEYR